MKRKIIRKVKTEIYELGYHTQSHESGLYESDKDGNPTVDPFKNCINSVAVKEVLLGTKEGFKSNRH